MSLLAAEEAPKGLLGQVATDFSRPSQPSATPFSYSEVVARCQPGVVTVIAFKYEIEAPAKDEEVKRLDLARPDASRQLPQEIRGNGSGVVITRSGLVLTNAHVVDGADRLRVLLPGRDDDLPARVIGFDSLTDVALLQIEAEGLTPLTVGDSAKLRSGDVVLALGSPFGLDQTVTMGIVSATGRKMNFIRGGYEDFIQTDASVNPGNSGGALVDGLGRLVGMNTARYPYGFGGSTGIGFAIPMNLALRIADDLLQHGHARRGFLGVKMKELDEEGTRKLTGQGNPRPAQIMEIEAGSPGDKAGFLMGDIVTGVDGRPMPSMVRLRQTIALMQPGAHVVFQVVRGGQKLELAADLAEAPLASAPATAPKGKLSLSQETSSPLRGLTVATLDNSERHGRGVPADVKGVVVLTIEPAEEGSFRNLRPGDVIAIANGRPVASVKEFADVIRSSAEGLVMLRTWRQGAEAFASVTKSASNVTVAPVPGLTLAPLDEVSRRERKIPADVNGVLVLQTEPVNGKPLGKIKAGDLILRVNSTAVSRVSDVAAAYNAAAGNTVMLRLWTPEGEVFAAITKQ